MESIGELVLTSGLLTSGWIFLLITLDKTLSLNHLQNISLFDGVGGGKEKSYPELFLDLVFFRKSEGYWRGSVSSDMISKRRGHGQICPDSSFFLQGLRGHLLCRPWPSMVVVSVKSLITSNSIPPTPLRPIAYFYVSFTVTLILFLFFTGFNHSWQI